MNTTDRKKWIAKNLILNENTELKLGMSVKDVYGKKGTVIEIDNWEGALTSENHGSITILFKDDNKVEHYSFYGWQSLFRLISDELAPSKLKI